MTDRSRLIPAVILGALGLLTLKLIGWTHGGPAVVSVAGQEQVGAADVDHSVDAGFSRLVTKARDSTGTTRASEAEVVARTRQAIVVRDPETTGSVPEKDKSKDDKAAKGKDDKGKDDKGKDDKAAKDPKAKDGKDAKDPKAKAPDAEADKAAAVEAKKQLENGPRNAATWINGAERPLSPAEKALIERLGERREEIDGRLKEIELREKMLETVERKIETRTGELKKLEDKSNEGSNEKAKQEAQGLKNIVIMYEAMKPKDAARIFDRLSHDILVPVVQQMNPRKMSEVLSAMQPEAAEKLTVAIASRALRTGTDPRAAMSAAVPGLPAGELPALPPAARP